jgi:hypothetical protein
LMNIGWFNEWKLLLCGCLQVGTVMQVQGENPVRFAKRTQLVADSYQVL